MLKSLFRVGGNDMFVPPHFQTQNLGMCPPPHILSRSYAVAYDGYERCSLTNLMDVYACQIIVTNTIQWYW